MKAVVHEGLATTSLFRGIQPGSVSFLSIELASDRKQVCRSIADAITAQGSSWGTRPRDSAASTTRFLMLSVHETEQGIGYPRLLIPTQAMRGPDYLRDLAMWRKEVGGIWLLDLTGTGIVGEGEGSAGPAFIEELYRIAEVSRTSLLVLSDCENRQVGWLMAGLAPAIFGRATMVMTFGRPSFDDLLEMGVADEKPAAGLRALRLIKASDLAPGGELPSPFTLSGDGLVPGYRSLEETTAEVIPYSARLAVATSHH